MENEELTNNWYIYREFFSVSMEDQTSPPIHASLKIHGLTRCTATRILPQHNIKSICMLWLFTLSGTGVSSSANIARFFINHNSDARKHKLTMYIQHPMPSIMVRKKQTFSIWSEKVQFILFSFGLQLHLWLENSMIRGKKDGKWTMFVIGLWRRQR